MNSAEKISEALKLPVAHQRLTPAEYVGTTILQLAEILRRQGWLLSSSGRHLIKVRLH